MKIRFTLLLATDEAESERAFLRVFRGKGYLFQCAQNPGHALEILQNTPIDAILIDIQKRKTDSLALVKEIRKKHPSVMMMIVVGGPKGIKTAVEAIRSGAADFVERPFSSHALRARMDQIYNIWKLRQENLLLRQGAGKKYSLDSLVGNTPIFGKMKKILVQAAESQANVLIQGETGTGKEIAARCVHSLSPRAQKAFVPVDCAAINENVLESELFGHEKGAFTGAYAAYEGLARAADGGTLFLDEIGEMPKSIQRKFLRFLQTREVRPVGSSKVHHVDVRIVCATNRGLKQDVEMGRFRKDLFYRLNVLPITIPPLREHKGDVAYLSTHFVMKFCEELGVKKRLSKSALICLEHCPWPGNVRELENAIQRAFVLCESDEIRPADLPVEVTGALAGSGSFGSALPRGDTFLDYEKLALENALKKAGGNRKRTARLLGVAEATLYRKLRRHKIT